MYLVLSPVLIHSHYCSSIHLSSLVPCYSLLTRKTAYDEVVDFLTLKLDHRINSCTINLFPAFTDITHRYSTTFFCTEWITDISYSLFLAIINLSVFVNCLQNPNFCKIPQEYKKSCSQLHSTLQKDEQFSLYFCNVFTFLYSY